MQTGALILVLAAACGVNSCRHAKLDAVVPTASRVSTEVPAMPASTTEVQARVDFATQIRPIFESHCQPCHFTGGVMYERRPFDRPETIHALGEKLFSRIKDENEQRLIREFLSQAQE
jgi:hypothetical protein